MTKVAVIGAGLSGLIVARRLQTVADVAVFEKSRGPGGRMATRRAGDFEFDYGAQFFTARTEAFQSFLQPLVDIGVVDEWHADFAEYDGSSVTMPRTRSDDYPRYVGVPRMNRIGKVLSADVHLAVDTTITAIAQSKDGWTLRDADGTQFGAYDWLVVTSPAAQTAALAEAFPDLVTFCGERRMLGCFALMLGFSEAIRLDWQAALVGNKDISWIAVNSSKPGRKRPFTLVVHSSNTWADAHMSDDLDFVLGHMLDQASSVTGTDMRLAAHRQVHRWRYANIAGQSGRAYFLDDERRLAACGDWCVRGRIEAAFTSASQLAESLIGRISL